MKRKSSATKSIEIKETSVKSFLESIGVFSDENDKIGYSRDAKKCEIIIEVGKDYEPKN